MSKLHSHRAPGRHRIITLNRPEVLNAWNRPMREAATRLAPYQVPRYVAVVAEFERTPSLRIMKHRLSPRTDDCFGRLSPAV